MRNFETLILLSPELAADAREQLLGNLKAILEREQGKNIEVEHWGMRDLAYPVRKQMRGYYVRFVYEGPNQIVAEFERNIRIADGIFKFITVRLDMEKESSDGV